MDVTGDPPVGALYQLTVLAFDPGVAVMLADPQNTALLAVGAPGTGLMVMLTEFLGPWQPLLMFVPPTK